MKKLLAILGVVVALIVIGVIVMFATKTCPPQGPWPMPPWCADKAALAKKGAPTKVTFYVAVPEGGSYDGLMLKINESQSVPMNRAAETVFGATVELPGQQEINYAYVSASAEEVGQGKIKVTRNNQFVIDSISEDAAVVWPADAKPEVFMMDTWGRNYNFLMIENTRDNIESAFDRVAALGAKAVTVTDMQQAYYSNEQKNYVAGDTNYEIKDAVFSDDFRDEALNIDDMKKLAQAAHSRGMEIYVEMSLSMRNIGKLLTSGNVVGTDAKFWEEFSKPKTEDWTKDFFDKYEAKILERARMLDQVGFDAYYITPRGTLQFHPYEAYANTRWQGIIDRLHRETKLKVFVFLNQGWLNEDWQEDWKQYDYYKSADRRAYLIESLPAKYQPQAGLSVGQLNKKFVQYLDDIENQAKRKNVSVNIAAGFASYGEVIKNGYLEFNDIANSQVKSAPADYAAQANAYEALLGAMAGRNNLIGFTMFGYWWDDGIDPETAKTKVSISPSTRNKPAEAVFKKWAKYINQK